MIPSVIWLTGLSGSGKSTLSTALAAGLMRQGVADLALLDGEEIRARLPRRYGHSLAERGLVLRQIVDMARQETTAGRCAIVATISHQRWMRTYARARLQRFYEVFLDCPPEVCATRDTKGHYHRALRGEYECFIGVTHAYEPSECPELVLDTARLPVDLATERLMAVCLPFLGVHPQSCRGQDHQTDPSARTVEKSHYAIGIEP